MWVETKTGLLNLAFVERISLSRRFVYFYRSETLSTASSSDSYRDVVGEIRYESDTAAEAAFARLKAYLTDIPESIPVEALTPALPPAWPQKSSGESHRSAGAKGGETRTHGHLRKRRRRDL